MIVIVIDGILGRVLEHMYGAVLAFFMFWV